MPGVMRETQRRVTTVEIAVGKLHEDTAKLLPALRSKRTFINTHRAACSCSATLERTVQRRPCPECSQTDLQRRPWPRIRRTHESHHTLAFAEPTSAQVHPAGWICGGQRLSRTGRLAGHSKRTMSMAVRVQQAAARVHTCSAPTRQILDHAAQPLRFGLRTPRRRGP